MRNTKSLHYRMGSCPFFYDAISPTIKLSSPLTGQVTEKSALISCDQYFALDSNLRHGHISTSPELAAEPSSINHFSALGQSHVLPKDMSLDDQFSTVVSRDCQSLADVQRLKLLKPSKSLFEDDEISVPTEPAKTE